MPFVSRQYCEIAGEYMSPDYARYRVDDHITNVFFLLQLIGIDRCIYLDEIVFEHMNYREEGGGRRIYGFKHPEIEKVDAEHFRRLLNRRKLIAIDLAGAITPNADAETRRRWREILSHVPEMNHQIAYNGFLDHGHFTPEGFVLLKDLPKDKAVNPQYYKMASFKGTS